MIVGLLFLGSCVGLLAGLVTLILGYSPLTTILVYLGAGLLGTVAPLALCAVKHQARKAKTLPQGAVDPLPDQ